MKNALDWLVSGSEFVNKPIAIFNASPRATHAQASLIEIMTTMSGCLIPEACIDVPLLGRGLDAVTIAGDSEIAVQVSEAILKIRDFVSDRVVNAIDR